MMLRVFSLLDIKVGTYSPPFFVAHPAIAYRMVGEVAKDQNTTVGRHPADYQLVELGTFDVSTGMFDTIPPQSHGAVVQFLPDPRPSPLFGLMEPEPQRRPPAPHANGAADRSLGEV